MTSFLERVFPVIYGSERNELFKSLFIAKRVKLKILTFGSLIMFFAALSFLVVRKAAKVPEQLDNATLIGIAIISLILFVYLRRTMNTKTGSIAFSLILALVLPLRIYMTGGVASPTVFGFVGFCVCVFLLLGRSWGIISFWYSIFCMFFIGIMNYMGKVAPYLAGDMPVFLAWVEISLLLMVTLPILFIIEEKDEMIRVYREKEKKRSSYLIMYRINHEFGNALAVATGLMDLYEKERDSDLLVPIEKSLREIETLIEGMEDFSKNGDLVSALDAGKERARLLNFEKRESDA